MDDPETKTPPVAPPNGHHVTNAELYSTLYQMDQRLAERDTAMLTMISGVRYDLSNHTRDGHPFTDQAGVLREELKLDAKKVGLGAAFVTMIAALASAMTLLMKHLGWGM